jgi:hypothetical protein
LAKIGQQITQVSCSFAVPDFVWDVMQDMDERLLNPNVKLGSNNPRLLNSTKW